MEEAEMGEKVGHTREEWVSLSGGSKKLLNDILKQGGFPFFETEEALKFVNPDVDRLSHVNTALRFAGDAIELDDYRGHGVTNGQACGNFIIKPKDNAIAILVFMKNKDAR